MGGGGQTSRTNSTSNTNQTQTTTTPGTSYGTALLPNVTELGNQVMDQQAFTGDRVAAAPDLGAGNYAAQWGQTPSTFVPQRTATDEAQQAMVTHVDPNYQQGIDQGLQIANQNTAALAPLVQGGYDRWNSIINGNGQNPNLDALIAAISQDAGEADARNRSNRMLYAGAEGAFGGTYANQNEAWASEQSSQALDRTIADLRSQDFYNNQQMLLNAPQQLAGWAGLSQTGTEQMMHYGNMQQENLAQAAAVGDENAQRLLNNLHQAQALNDANAERAAQEAISQWQAQYQQEQARVADLQGRTQAQTANNQAGLDNAYLAWLNQQELLSSQIGNLQGLVGVTAGVPGGTSTSQGQTTSQSTTRTQQESSPWQIASGLLGAGMQMFSPGGFFSGGLSALGGGLKSTQQTAPIQPYTPPANLTPINPINANPGFSYSDRRLKKDLEPVGDGRWLYRYIWDSDDTPLRVGVMASDVEQFAPHLVATDAGGFKMVDYIGLEREYGATTRL